MIFRQLIFYALLVGALSGLVSTVVQMWQVVPIILNAEVYEGESESVPAHEHTGQNALAAHEHPAEEWTPDDGIERVAYTLLANALTAMGFALLMMAAMMASLNIGRKNKAPLNWRHGLVWGGAGYAVFYLMPTLGLPPEIPGVDAGPLEARQLWWLFSVVFTAAGLAGLAFAKSPWRWAAPLLLVVPYLVGAPQPPGPMFADQSPAAAAELEGLANQFIGATAIANAALWVVLGFASAWAVRRIELSSEEESPSKIETPSFDK
ncbi:MAG: CbtA family protein [Gammaproteobacteria bacterium]|nr:MAG: CbtA family protein [Gammaproteobacteria bacterium]